MMDTNEVAAYLRLKRRRIYELVHANQIPCTRVTGKWLFPRAAVDRWLEQNTTRSANVAATPATAVAGSHDPLLEWAVRESRCGLAMLPGGSLDGLRRLAAGEAVIAGMHVLEAEGMYNVTTVQAATALSDAVVIEWAGREQGLVVAPGNPLKLSDLNDVAKSKARLIRRQDEAGSQILLLNLLAANDLALSDLKSLPAAAGTENDLGLAIVEGKADVGLAVRSVATQFSLGFVPLHKERFDLVMRRRDYFEPPLQKLLSFTRTPAFARRAEDFGGYDVTGVGRVVFNA
jgi:excisionase family DNA binding protein